MIYRYSTIQDFYKCPRYYELKNIHGIKEEQSSSALIFGTLVHEAINTLLKGRSGALVKFVDEWDKIRGIEMVYYGRDTWGMMQNDGIELINKFEQYQIKHFEPTFLEQKLSGSIKTIKVEGTVDCAGLYKGIPAIVDFKTSSKRYQKDKLLVNDQLYVYNHIMAQKGLYEAKKHVYVVLKKTSGDGPNCIQVIERDVSKQDVKYATDNFHDVCLEIEKKKSFTRNTNACIMGEYRCSMFSNCYKKVE